MAQSETLLSIRDAERVYRMGEVDVPALRDANLEIREGEFLVIVGPSGSGKSTLLNLIGGMDRPTSGTVRYRDHDLTKASDHELTLFRRTEIGFVFQFYNLIPTLTAYENVQVAIELLSKAMSPKEALNMVGLAERSDHFPSQLSGGQQQRVSIARALAKQPGLLLCDEPTGALDMETSKQVLEILVNLNRELGKTVVLITHNNAIAQIADRVAHICDGAIRSVEVNSQPADVNAIAW